MHVKFAERGGGQRYRNNLHRTSNNSEKRGGQHCSTGSIDNSHLIPALDSGRNAYVCEHGVGGDERIHIADAARGLPGRRSGLRGKGDIEAQCIGAAKVGRQPRNAAQAKGGNLAETAIEGRFEGEGDGLSWSAEMARNQDWNSK